MQKAVHTRAQAPQRARTRGWRDAVMDIAPAAGLWTAGLLDLAYGLSDAVGTAAPWTSAVPMTFVCALLLLRRRLPLPALCGIVVVLAVPIWFVPLALGYWGEFIPWLVALYSCARHEEQAWRRIAGAGISAVSIAVIALRYPEMADPSDLLYDGALLAGAWALGLFARSWARYRDDALRQEVERAQAEEQAASRERSRIARELHDIISHTITVIVMQAGGARLAAASDPHLAVEALGRIERLGQDSLGELRTLLAVLGGVRAAVSDGEDASAPAPQPTLADVRALCERMHELGLPVRLRIHDLHADGDELSAVVPAGVQLAAYRVVQEGLTNVLKHAGSVATTVEIRRERDASRPVDSVRVEVSSAAGTAATLVTGGSRGLVGMRERVAALGGTVTASARPDGGFVISAALPLAERPA